MNEFDTSSEPVSGEKWLCIGDKRIARLHDVVLTPTDVPVVKQGKLVGFGALSPRYTVTAHCEMVLSDGAAQAVAEWERTAGGFIQWIRDVAAAMQDNPRAALFLGEDGRWGGTSSPSSMAALRWDAEMSWWSWTAWSSVQSRHVEGSAGDLVEAMAEARKVVEQ